MWKKQGLLRILNNHLVDYPSPVNVNYFWSIGSIAGIMFRYTNNFRCFWLCIMFRMLIMLSLALDILCEM